MIVAPRRIQRLLAARDYDGLVDAMAHGRRRDRRAAARALGKLGDARAVEPLGRALRDAYGDDEDLPPIVVAALDDLDDPMAAEPLTDLLADTRDDAFYFLAQREALFVLAELGVLAPLEALVSDPTRDPVLRSEAEGLLRRHRATEGASE
jgi:HEAT repeat protein